MIIIHILKPFDGKEIIEMISVGIVKTLALLFSEN
jgi:hypothetical protein